MAKLTIKSIENGPYMLPGVEHYIDEAGESQPVRGKGLALCRCGHSANKPFCDGAHKKFAFEAPAVMLQLDVS